MRRWVIDRFGRDGLRLDGAPLPVAGPGEARVRVAAVALNARDLMMIDHGMGLDLSFPFVPASDMAGVVDVVGGGVSRFRPGDRVIASFLPEWIDGRPGGMAKDPSYRTLGGHYPGILAEYVCMPEDWLVAAPASLGNAEAATLPVAGLTAWFALVEQGHVRAGDSVLVPGTGGVALFAVQLAAAHGAEVIVTSSSDDKLARVEALGARHGINRNGEDVVAAVHRITAGRGVDHVLDLVGGENFAVSIEAVAPGGRVSVIGLLGSAELRAPTTPVLLKAPMIQGIVTGHRRALEDLVRAVDRIGLKPVIDGRYAFTKLPKALDHLASGAFGKVVVEVTTSED
ncbi:zinc-dependent alcohol dehydrogenase family protein [Lichenicoccus sp.]|uniref:zinc-dependent alcohol dehydrogenase family protein n=1 Tax=Lichenicoccus sp. TaxID=2781899 RepID=UPI003D11D7E7